MCIKGSCTIINMSQKDETNIQVSPVAVLPPALRSNRTHHVERRHLKIKKYSMNLYYITEV